MIIYQVLRAVYARDYKQYKYCYNNIMIVIIYIETERSKPPATMPLNVLSTTLNIKRNSIYVYKI